MLTKEEKLVFQNYNIFSECEIDDYLVDFIMMNPLNFPITSCIMSMVDYHQQCKTFEELFHKQTVKESISNFTRRYKIVSETVTKTPLYRKHNITTLMLLLYSSYNYNEYDDNMKMSIIDKKLDKNGIISDVTICLYHHNYELYVVIDSDFKNGLFIFKSSEYRNFTLNVLKENYSTMIEQGVFPCNGYYFPTCGFCQPPQETGNEEFDRQQKISFMKYKWLLLITYLFGINRNTWKDEYSKNSQYLKAIEHDSLNFRLINAIASDNFTNATDIATVAGKSLNDAIAEHVTKLPDQTEEFFKKPVSEKVWKYKLNKKEYGY